MELGPGVRFDPGIHPGEGHRGDRKRQRHTYVATQGQPARHRYSPGADHRDPQLHHRRQGLLGDPRAAGYRRSHRHQANERQQPQRHRGAARPRVARRHDGGADERRRG